jgi:spore coat-associated protein N
MNKMKKALLGTALAGTIVVGAGFGTYSWFNAEVLTSGEVTNYTLKLNGDTQDTITLNPTAKKLAPGRSISETFNIKNDGELDQIVRGGLNFTLYDGEVVSGVNKNMYDVSVVITWTDKNGDLKGSRTITTNAAAADAAFAGDTWFPSESGSSNPDHYFMSGDNLKFDVTYGLNSAAGNVYQGLTLEGEFEFDGKQTDTGSEFQ